MRANREKALLSHVFNSAREWGYTDSPNPCAGVKGHRETGRDRYVEDAEYRAVYERAHFTVQDAMDLAYLTGQRPADVLKMQRSDVRDDALWITQGKTGKKLRIEVTGELAAVITRIQNRPRKAAGLALIQDEKGQRLTHFALRSRFDNAREAAGVNFQFRDIRAKAATDAEDLEQRQHQRRIPCGGCDVLPGEEGGPDYRVEHHAPPPSGRGQAGRSRTLHRAPMPVFLGNRALSRTRPKASRRRGFSGAGSRCGCGAVWLLAGRA